MSGVDLITVHRKDEENRRRSSLGGDHERRLLTTKGKLSSSSSSSYGHGGWPQASVPLPGWAEGQNACDVAVLDGRWREGGGG
jgi:hypothetical protein